MSIKEIIKRKYLICSSRKCANARFLSFRHQANINV